MKYTINSYELFLYYCVWTSAIFIAIYNLYKDQNEILENVPSLRRSLDNLAPSWDFLGRNKDVSDIEWSCWNLYIKTSGAYLMFQFFVSEIIRQHKVSLLKHWYILSSIIYILLFMNARQLLLVLAQPFLFFILIICGGKQASIWVTSVLLLLTYNSFLYKYYVWQFLDDGTSMYEKIFLLLFAVGWIELRCISFCLDCIGTTSKKSEEKCCKNYNLYQSLINMFSYVLYLPLLHVGPIILYEEFEKSFQVKNESLWLRLQRFAVDMIIFAIYSIILECTLHYIYFGAMVNEMTLINKLSSVALCGAGLWMSFLFHVKYVVSYGTTAAYARLDNINSPPTPRCIARIHVYSQMWRYFDVGLYKFLVKYIYKPLHVTLRRHTNLSHNYSKLIATFSTFAFILLWHGLTSNILIWSVMNFCGIFIENIARELSKTHYYEYFKQNVLKTDAMEARFIAVLCSPLLAMSAISNFYLFGGMAVGHTFVGLLNWPAPHNVMLMLIATYCCSQVSMSLLDVPSRTDVKVPRIKTVL